MIVPIVALLLWCVVDKSAGAGCNGMCEACVQRYGCMTPAWGRCCTQFYQHNGRKRNMPGADEKVSIGNRLTPHPRPATSVAATRMLKSPAVKSPTPWLKRSRPKRANDVEVTQQRNQRRGSAVCSIYEYTHMEISITFNLGQIVRTNNSSTVLTALWTLQVATDSQDDVGQLTSWSSYL